jgi:hypothetical protein
MLWWSNMHGTFGQSLYLHCTLNRHSDDFGHPTVDQPVGSKLVCVYTLLTPRRPVAPEIKI